MKMYYSLMHIVCVVNILINKYLVLFTKKYIYLSTSLLYKLALVLPKINIATVLPKCPSRALIYISTKWHFFIDQQHWKVTRTRPESKFC